MKTRVLERAKSNLLLLCALFVTVKNMVLNSYYKFMLTKLLYHSTYHFTNSFFLLSKNITNPFKWKGLTTELGLHNFLLIKMEEFIV